MYVCTYVFVCVCVCVCMCMCACACACMHVRAWVRTRARVWAVCVRMLESVCVCICVSTYVFAHVCARVFCESWCLPESSLSGFISPSVQFDALIVANNAYSRLTTVSNYRMCGKSRQKNVPYYVCIQNNAQFSIWCV